MTQTPHPRITELLEYVDRKTDRLRAAYESIPAEKRGERPAPGRWSAAEVVHHVAIVEARLTQRLKALIEQARALPPETETSPVLTTIETRKVETRTNRFVTSELGEPRDTNVSRVWPEFEATRQSLKDLVATAHGLALGAVSAPHPALGPLTGYEWLAFVGAHASRHADQILEDAGKSVTT